MQPVYNNQTQGNHHSLYTECLFYRVSEHRSWERDGHRLSDGEGCIVQGHGVGVGGIVVKYCKLKFPFRYIRTGEY